MESWNIEFRNLSAGYGKTAVLTGINAILPSGKISVILGGSGCGKSTLLKHIVGLARPIAGQILFGKKNIAELKGKELAHERRRIGLLFQDGALLGALTLWENVALPLSQHLSLPVKVLHEAALRVLGMVGLAEYEDYFPNQLSGGMRKRAGLARAIIAEPGLLLCDEPTSGLDPVTAAKMDNLLLSLHAMRPEMTIVVVSHDLSSLKKIADHVLVLGKGKALFSGTLNELEATADSYLRQFLNREADSDNLDLQKPANELVLQALEKWFKA